MGEWHEGFCDRGERPNCQISGELVAEIFKGLEMVGRSHDSERSTHECVRHNGHRVPQADTQNIPLSDLTQLRHNVTLQTGLAGAVPSLGTDPNGYSTQESYQLQKCNCNLVA